MGRTNSELIGIALVVLLTVPSKAQDQVVYVSTLDWPPYTASDLPRGGATSDVVRRAFDQAGYRVEITYRSWKQAIEMAVDGTQGVIAYFPGYHCRHQQGFVASDPVGSGVLGFAEHVDAPITWETLDSLSEQKLKIGTVMGYANTDEFDAKVGTGWIIAIPSEDDTSNLEKLARKRIDAVVIDKSVLKYLKATAPSLKDHRTDLQFNERPLEDKTLHLCFRDDEAGRAMLRQFNAGLQHVNPDQLAEEYLSTAFSR